ncbi:MAG TPA: hypothetical protein VJU87_10710 [Gemmatimonadaceae bacterium]|nr:hypothetical protein [Gemmatimonadaceae bacterium]
MTTPSRCPPRLRRIAPFSYGGAALLLAAAACARVPAASTPAPTPSRAPAAPAITTGRDLLRAMHERYASTWYHTVTFAQQTTITLGSGGALVQHWLEAGKIPGRLRIDTDTATQSGVLYAGDSLYRFSSGRMVASDTGRNDLLILGFDVYGQPVDSTVAVLAREGYDLSSLHRDSWQGVPVYVVGAAAGDTTTKQFWVEQDRLLFVRLLEPQRAASGTHHNDIRFLKYVAHGGGWVAEEVMFYADGKPRVHEEYSSVRVDVPLSDAQFDPRQWSTATPWYRP